MNIARRTMIVLLVMSIGSPAWASDKTIGRVMDDNWIHAKVKTALVKNEIHNVNVEVHAGEVLLAGFVFSEKKLEQAVDVTEHIRGVSNVRAHLYVRDRHRTAGKTLDDGVIASRVKAELARDKRTHVFDINVEVRNGVVLLSGFIRSRDEAKVALQLAEHTEGVHRVINGMEVMPS